MTDRPKTLGELKASGYQSVSVKQEMRNNLIRLIQSGEPMFPGILGYDQTVIPEIQNALLAKHDLLCLGLRGQGKTRMLRMLTRLLDETLPIVAGSEIQDDPLNPISYYARDLIAQKGDETPIDYIGRDERYHEKLATPDVTIADLIGEIDLIKHASGKELSSEQIMHFGLIPRSNRGIFCMNELPDLSAKIQVGLFNVLEERDIQIRGFSVRLNLDVCMVFSANPEDYTNRGRIVTPLKDRIGSVIRTHYPLSRSQGVEITRQQAWLNREEGPAVIVPGYLEEVIEETARLARKSPHVNQASGVSVRMSIANLENVTSNAERQALLSGRSCSLVRPMDLYAMSASARGKMELALSEEAEHEDELFHRIVQEAFKNLFDQYTAPKRFKALIQLFENGLTITTGEGDQTSKLGAMLKADQAVADSIEQLARELDPDLAASEHQAEFLEGVLEFVLEGLYCHNRINKKPTQQGQQFAL